MQQIEERKLAVLCAYLSTPGMEHTETILAEARNLMQTAQLFKKMAALIVESGQVSLLDEMEAIHGKRAYGMIEIYNSYEIEKIERSNMADYVRERVYRNAIKQRIGNAVPGEFKQLVGVAATAHSKAMMRVLFDDLAPTPANLLEILQDNVVTESAAFTGQPKFIAKAYSEARFSPEQMTTIASLALDRGNTRALAIAARIGGMHATPQGFGGKPFATSLSTARSLILSGLSSNHGRLRLTQDLPRLEALFWPSEKTLEKNLVAVLTRT